MLTQTYISTYLVPAAPVRAHRLTPRQQLILLAPGLRLPQWRAKTVLGVASWLFLILGTGWAFSQYTVPDPGRVAAGASSAVIAQAQLASAVKAPELPAGPSGLLLPPGAMAPAYTYRNGYSAGQCTWYVAGRRPIPGGWGNARSWYYHAAASGWPVGTTPAVGAIAWTSAGWYGHVALVEAVQGNQVLISEMNYLGSYKIDKRWVGASSFKYIY
jgi:hypothetical protein